MLKRLALPFALVCAALPAAPVSARAQDLQQTFKIRPLHPVTELRAAALKAQPPAESGDFAKPDLVELVKIDPSIKLDIHYASTNNFLGTPVYTQARAFLQRPAAEALARVNAGLHKHGYGLLIFDGYRPWYVTKIFWDATPPNDHDYVADPSQGSRHNRGCAVDLTVFELKSGKPLDMPSGYDDFTTKAHPDYAGGSELQRANRDMLRYAMEAEGFTVYTTEWWHFDYKDWKSYAILNTPFEELKTETAVKPLAPAALEVSGAADVVGRIHEQWAKAMHAKKLDDVVALYTPDGEFLQPTGERISGRAAIRELTQNIFGMFTSDLTFKTDRVEQSGDLIYDSGEFRETLTAVSSGAVSESHGSYLMVLKRTPEGWRIAQQAWMGTMPKEQ